VAMKIDSEYRSRKDAKTQRLVLSEREGTPLRLCVGLFIVFFQLWLAGTSLVRADHGPADLHGEVSYEQKLDEQVPLDVTFRDEGGRMVQLGDYFGERPVILSLGYLECPMLCPIVREELVISLQELEFDAGNHFDVLVVSIDPGETASIAASKKEHIVQLYGRPGTADGWHFLTGSPASIEQLTQAVGFHYEYDAARDEYAHPSGIVVLTPEGKISRYFYGIMYPAKDLRLGLVEASANKIGSAVDQLLLLCYHYDPVTGQYTFAILTVLRLLGLATVMVVGIGLFILFRRNPELKPAAISRPVTGDRRPAPGDQRPTTGGQ